MLATLLPKMIVAGTADGASDDVWGVLVPEPMCMARTVPVSAHRRRRTAPSSRCRATAGRGTPAARRTPRRARRALRCDAPRRSPGRRPTAGPGRAGSGGRRWCRTTPRPSSRCRPERIASARSLSLPQRNIWPQKRGKFGKQSCASTPLSCMSSMRARPASSRGACRRRTRTSARRRPPRSRRRRWSASRT